MTSDIFIYLLIILQVALLSILIWLCILLFRKPKKQNLQMQQLARDLNLELKSQPGKSLQDIEGTYKGKIIKIFSLLDPKVRFTRIRAVVIQLFGANPLELSFLINRRTWMKNFSTTTGYLRLKFPDPNFDNQFVIHSNQPDILYSILTDSVQAKFLSIKENYDFKGAMELNKNLMTYLEHFPIDTNHKRKRFEAMTDLMSTLKDSMDNYFKTLQS